MRTKFKKSTQRNRKEKSLLLVVLLAGFLGGFLGALILFFLFSFPSQLEGSKPITLIAQKVSPSVVTIRTRFERKGGLVQEKIGCGVILRDDGYIVTNRHLVFKAKEILVKVGKRREKKAKLVGSKKDQDIAIIKIEAPNLKEADLGSSSSLKVGEEVFAIGTPFRYTSEYTVTKGVISALPQNLPQGFPTLLQTDAIINPGNSGGPLCNMKGEVIAITTAYLSSGESIQGIGFAVPIDLVKSIFDEIVRE